MPKQTLTIVVEFDEVLSPHATRDVQAALADFKEAIYLGRFVRAELAVAPPEKREA